MNWMMLRRLPLILFLQTRCVSSSNISDSLRNLTENFDQKFKNIVFMVGAGLSTPSGIPDFRSPGVGLYDNLKKYKLNRPEDMFELTFFEKHPEPFFDLAKELYPGKYKPNLGHYFIYLLQEKGKLLRLYTQNIDGLERLAGIEEQYLVEAHGTFSTASCIECKKQHDPKKVREDVFNNIVTRCNYCKKGIVKPDIIFFGEMLPERYHTLCSVDPDLTDLVFIIGTSLEVYPFAWLCETVPLNVPRVLINREKVGMIGSRKNDIIVKGDIIESLEVLVKQIGWYEELKNLMNKKLEGLKNHQKEKQ